MLIQPSILQVGMDDIINLFQGRGPQDQCPLDLSLMSKDDLSNLAFLFGGVGDGERVLLHTVQRNLPLYTARHVFGTITGYRQALLELPESERSSCHVHITLNDIHPAVLARNLVLFQLLNDLKNETGTTLEEYETNATLMYTYWGVAMPSYCFARYVTKHRCSMLSWLMFLSCSLQSVIQELRSRLFQAPWIFPWLYVATESIPSIISVLDSWSDLHERKPTAEILKAHTFIDGKT